MQITSKKFTDKGRNRFGSAIFINDIEEDRIDKLRGVNRDASLLISVIILLMVKILSANIFGILITIPIFILAYFVSAKSETLSYTTQRLLIETEYANPKITKIIGNTMVVIILFIIIRSVIDLDDLDTRLSLMHYVFFIFRLLDSRYLVYRNFTTANYFIFYGLDSIATVLISVWFAYQYRSLKFEFTEINLSNISEQLVKIKPIITLKLLFFLSFLYIFIHLTVFSGLSFVSIFVVILLSQVLPREKYVILSLVGTSSRFIIRDLIIPYSQLPNVSRTTAGTFGWIPQRNQISRKFPENIIPREVTSIYDTGLRAYSKQAYRQANVLGLIISIIINSFVILSLFLFAKEAEFFNDVFVFSLGLIGVTVLLFLTFSIITKLRIRYLSEEKLLIGSGIVGRFVKKSLWISKGSSLEGTTIHPHRSRALFRFDKTRGLIIEWERFTILLITLFFIVLIVMWNSLGALNLRAIPRLFPSLLTFGAEFIEQKARSELEFFIITSFVLWIMILIFYPRYYAGSRPTLFLDMDYASVEPIILKDYKEHQEASLNFTESLLANKRKYESVGRPGTFVLSLTADQTIRDVKSIRFYAGENKIVADYSLPLSSSFEVYRNLFVSAKKGYPELEVIIELYNDRNLVVSTQLIMFELFYDKYKTISIDFEQYGSIELNLKIQNQKS